MTIDLSSAASVLDYLGLVDDGYPWSDAYNSADDTEYTWMIMHTRCPVHGTNECPCIDSSTLLTPGEMNPDWAGDRQ